MIDFLKGMSVNDRQKFKEFRKYSPRTVNEISEDQIATVAINEICDALHSDVDLVYDALVASDLHRGNQRSVTTQRLRSR